MNRFDQGWPCVAEKVMVQQSRRGSVPTGRKTGSRQCEAVAGMSLQDPMT